MSDSSLLMCKDIAVYNIATNTIMNTSLVPGALKKGTLTFIDWMQKRYSVGSNVSARRLMLRAFGSDNHNTSLDRTRALSLSDCYWIKNQSEMIRFEDVSPYYKPEWDGTGKYMGGSIATLFSNGAANKKWIHKDTLVKYSSAKELIPYQLAKILNISNMAEVILIENDLHVTNFTSTDKMLETLEQSGYVGEKDIPLEIAVSLWGETAVSLLVLDYLVEHDDRHMGNLGFLRDTHTGEYLCMAPFYDFDWAWSDGVTPLPKIAFKKYNRMITSLCNHALASAAGLAAPYNEIVIKRAKELLIQTVHDIFYTPSP